MRPLLPIALLAVLAGCVAPALQPAAAPVDAATDLLPVEAPKVDAAQTLKDLKAFSHGFPYRQSGTPNHKASRDWLEKAFQDAGLETIRQKFPMTVRGAPVGQYDGENVIGIKWGADREHWVVVGAHYDVTEGAVYGTYDDGSGTILTVELARAFAALNTTRTIAFIEFDEEERGLVGSKAFVTSIIEGTFEVPNVTVDAMVDLDMVGITWPHPAHLVCWDNSPLLQNKTKELAAGVGIPESNLEFRKPRGGSSDGASFIAADIPTAYFWSDWDSVVLKGGQAIPASYPFWHQVDTYDSMVLMAGDEATLTAGFQTTLDVVSPLLAYAASGAYDPSASPAPSS